MSAPSHISQELALSSERVHVKTRFGIAVGGRAKNGVAVFLEIPYASAPNRFEDPEPLAQADHYQSKEFLFETAYAVQPTVNGQAAGFPPATQLGLGKPSENPLFLDIYVPSSFNGDTGAKFPVKVYIHGGFLQFGSPHGMSSQANHISEAKQEIYINIGYRLSAFGFLASATPKVTGNFGFKDQWLALQWIHENIEAFGGNPKDVTLTGLSAGAHSVHQILHRASHLPEGQKAPFQRAQMQSNAIVFAPKTLVELQEQFVVLCKALKIDPADPEALKTLKDPAKVPWDSITSLIDEDKLGPFGTFRGSLNDDWLPSSIDPMVWQSNGGLASGLRRVGVKSIVVGDLKDEWYLYAIAHPITNAADIRANLLRYYPEEKIDALLKLYPTLEEDAPQQECFRRFGQVLSDCQVHLPVRLLARDLIASNFPVLRYEIRWAPGFVRKMLKGFVTHGADRSLWYYFEPMMEEDEKEAALTWLNTVEKCLHETESGSKVDLEEVLTLREDKTSGWEADKRLEELMRLEIAIKN